MSVKAASDSEGFTNSRRVAAAIVVLLGIYTALFLYYVYQTRILRPHSDLFDLIDFYIRSAARGDFLTYLFAPHGEFHRIVWLRLLVAADVSIFRGNGLAFLVTGLVAVTATAGLLAREAAAEAGRFRLPAVALALMLVLSSANAADVSVPAATSYTQTVFFAVCAIILVTRRARSNGQLAVLRAGALACACGAAFGNAVGLTVWPALVFMAWRDREERAWPYLVLLAGTAFTAAYVSGQPAPAMSAALSVDSLFTSLDYFFAYLGLPWVRASGVLGRLIGLTLFTAATVALVRTGGKGLPGAARVGQGLILFSLGTAVLAALGRSGETAIIDVPVRYALLLAPLHVGLLLIALPSLTRFGSARPGVTQGTILATLFMLLLQQVLVGRIAAQAAERSREVISRFEQGQRAPDMTAIVHPDLEHATTIEAEIRRRGLYRPAGP